MLGIDLLLVVPSIAVAVPILFWARREGPLTPTAVAIVLQVCLSLTFWSVFGLQGDAQAYDALARELANLHGEMSNAVVQPMGKMSLIWLLASGYSLGAQSPVPVLLLLAVLMGMLPILFFKATKNFGHPESATLSAWCGALLPQVVFWSPWLRREGLAFLLLALTVLAVSLLTKGDTVKGLACASMSAAGMWFTRPQLLMVVSAGLLASAVVIIAKPRTPDWRNTAAALGTLVGSVAIGVSALSFTASSDLLDPKTRAVVVQSNADASQALAVDWVRSKIESADPQNPANDIGHNALSSVPLRIASVFLGPLPQEWSSWTRVLLSLEGVAIVVILSASLLIAWRRSSFRALTFTLWLAAAPLFLGSAVSIANYGILSRVRAHIIVIVVPVIASVSMLVFKKIEGLRTMASKEN